MPITLDTLIERSTQNYKDRTDLQDFAQQGIDYATDYFNLKLRVRQMMTAATLTPDADGICTVPNDFIELITVVEDTAYGSPLSLMTNVSAGNVYYANTGGLGVNYTLTGSQLMLRPVSTNDVNILYYAKIPYLEDQATSGSASTETNWLLEQFPLAYMDATRMFLADIADDQAAEARYAGKVDTWIETMNERNMTSMYSRMTTDLSDEMIVP